MPDDKQICVEVVYGNDQKQKLYRFRLPENSTARQAVLHSPILRDFPNADLNAPLGIFGKRVKDETVLHDGDRVELYRSLIADPKEARRQRATRK